MTIRPIRKDLGDLRDVMVSATEPTVRDDGDALQTNDVWLDLGSDPQVWKVYDGAAFQTIGSGTDDDAIHDNVSGEIAAVTEKTTPVSADLLLIEDSAASNVKKRVQVGNLPGGTSDTDAIHDNVAGEISALTLVTAASSDHVLIEDASDSDNKKRVAASDFLGGGGGGTTWLDAVASGNGPAGTSDDEFDDSSIDAAWTQVTPAGTVAWTEDRDVLSAKFSGLGSAQSAGILKAIPGTPAAPTTIETAVRWYGPNSNYTMFSLVFTEGTNATDAASQMIFFMNTSDTLMYWNHYGGSLNAAGGSITNYKNRLWGWAQSPWWHVRFKWTAANTFAADISPDGVSWAELWSGSSRTISPTHFGLGVTNWSGPSDRIVTFEYFRVS